MSQPSIQRELRFSILICVLVITFSGFACPEKNYDYPPFSSHISSNNALYKGGDTGWSGKASAPRYVRRDRNRDLTIVLPEAGKGHYRIRFFDADNRMIFEIRNLRDSLLTVEKCNFQRAGQFRYELFKDNVIVEKNTFLIKKEL